MSGHVYISGNENIDAVKIGMTERSPSERVSELSSKTSTPGSLKVLYSIKVIEPLMLESSLHHCLREYRIDGSEFFKVTVEKVFRVIHRLMEQPHHKGVNENNEFNGMDECQKVQASLETNKNIWD